MQHTLIGPISKNDLLKQEEIDDASGRAQGERVKHAHFEAEEGHKSSDGNQQGDDIGLSPNNLDDPDDWSHR